MKTITEFLSTKIKHDIILHSDIVEKVLEYFMILKDSTDESTYKYVFEFVNDWIVSNGIDKWIEDDNVEPNMQFVIICGESTWTNLIRHKGKANKKIYNMLSTKYGTFDEGIILSKKELSHKENEEEFKELDCKMWTTDCMIACELPEGTVYCWTNKDFFEKYDKMIHESNQ